MAGQLAAEFPESAAVGAEDDAQSQLRGVGNNLGHSRIAERLAAVSRIGGITGGLESFQDSLKFFAGKFPAAASIPFPGVAKGAFAIAAKGRLVIENRGVMERKSGQGLKNMAHPVSIID